MALFSVFQKKFKKIIWYQVIWISIAKRWILRKQKESLKKKKKTLEMTMNYEKFKFTRILLFLTSCIHKLMYEFDLWLLWYIDLDFRLTDKFTELCRWSPFRIMSWKSCPRPVSPQSDFVKGKFVLLWPTRSALSIYTEDKCYSENKKDAEDQGPRRPRWPRPRSTTLANHVSVLSTLSTASSSTLPRFWNQKR